MTTPWTERRFCFDDLDPEAPQRWVDAVGESPTTAMQLVDGCSEALLTERFEGRWSIQENVAHLADLDEETFLPRIRQYETGEPVLAPADMANTVTENAGHNRRGIAEVLARFEQTRGAVVRALAGKPAEFFRRSALHERLNVRMRVLELVSFKLEHDRHHLARAAEILRLHGPAH